MHMKTGLYRLDDTADYASILRHALTNAKVLQRQLVAQGDRLFCTRHQARVVSKVSSDAIRAWLQVHYGDTDTVGGIVYEKMNHLSSFPRNNTFFYCMLPSDTCLVSKTASNPSLPNSRDRQSHDCIE
jgi:hypothetical protein